ncbi:MAG TPA: hypothetical protein VHA52_13140 [Candidatus Babeliaceae bacterium]|nr:hypothetical protein [Candidatus Babeliaceae bacterium]
MISPITLGVSLIFCAMRVLNGDFVTTVLTLDFGIDLVVLDDMGFDKAKSYNFEKAFIAVGFASFFFKKPNIDSMESVEKERSRNEMSP